MVIASAATSTKDTQKFGCSAKITSTSRTLISHAVRVVAAISGRSSSTSSAASAAPSAAISPPMTTIVVEAKKPTPVRMLPMMVVSMTRRSRWSIARIQSARYRSIAALTLRSR